MKKRFKKLSVDLIIFVVALQILNISVTGRITDESFPQIKIDDSVNIADHALEFVVENVLGFTSAFPEKREVREPHSATCFQKLQLFSLFVFHPEAAVIPYPAQLSETYSSLVIAGYSQYLREIVHPPPRYA